MTSIADPEPTYQGLDVHKDTISVGVLEPGSDSPAVDKILHEEPSDAVHRPGAYRGHRSPRRLTLAAEVCDCRRFPRAGASWAFVGLVPSEYSSGSSTHRGHLTKAGNAHLRTQLIESCRFLVKPGCTGV